MSIALGIVAASFLGFAQKDIADSPAADLVIEISFFLKSLFLADVTIWQSTAATPKLFF